MSVTVIDTPEGISYAQLASLKCAVKLEALGMKHSSGKSMSALAKRQLGLKRNTPAADVVKAIQAKMDAILELAA